MYFIDIDIGQNGGGKGTGGKVNGSVIWVGRIKNVPNIGFTHISLNHRETETMPVIPIISVDCNYKKQIPPNLWESQCIPVNTIESCLTLKHIESMQIIDKYYDNCAWIQVNCIEL